MLVTNLVTMESNEPHDVIMWLYEKWPEMETIDFSTSEDDDEHALYKVLSNDPSLQQLHLDHRCGNEKDIKYNKHLMLYSVRNTYIN